MRRQVYHYRFAPHVDPTRVRDLFRLAHHATQSVFGRNRVLLEARYDLIDEDRTGWIDARCDVGLHLHRVFVGYLSRRLDEDAFDLTASPPEAVGHDPIPA